MAQQRALPQSKETLLQSYNKRLKDDIKSIMDNFTEIIKTAKVRGRPVSCASGHSAPGEGSARAECNQGPGAGWWPLSLWAQQLGSSLG